MNNMSNMTNIGYSPAFPGQYMQPSPTQFGITPAITPPQWAIDMMEDIKIMSDDTKNIKTSVPKIDGIEKSVNLMTAQLSDLSIKVNDIDKRVTDTEQFNSFINSEYERQILELSTTKADVNSLKEKCNSMKHTIKSIECTNAQIQAEVAENEFRSMKDNLIFYGISETALIPVLSTQSNKDTFNGATSDDNIGMEPDEQEISHMSTSTDLETPTCEVLVKQFIKDVLKVKADTIVFNRAHMQGNDRKSKKPRPIIVKFHYYNDRNTQGMFRTKLHKKKHITT
jgi:hypothetical protein